MPYFHENLCNDASWASYDDANMSVHSPTSPGPVPNDANDGIILYHASWEIHDDNQPPWESHSDEQSLWESHDDDQQCGKTMLMNTVLSRVPLCLQRCSCRLGYALISKPLLVVSLYDVSLILISELVSMSLLSLHPGITTLQWFSCRLGTRH